MTRAVLLSPDAVEDLEHMQATEGATLRDAIRQRLGEEDAACEDRNRFRLRRPSTVAEFELRVCDLRVFYRIVPEGVQVIRIGRKRRERLMVRGRRFVL